MHSAIMYRTGVYMYTSIDLSCPLCEYKCRQLEKSQSDVVDTGLIVSDKQKVYTVTISTCVSYVF